MLAWVLDVVNTFKDGKTWTTIAADSHTAPTTWVAPVSARYLRFAAVRGVLWVSAALALWHEQHRAQPPGDRAVHRRHPSPASARLSPG